MVFMVVIFKGVKSLQLHIQRQALPDFDKSPRLLPVCESLCMTCLEPEVPICQEPAFVPGGDKGTDFPIMNRLGAVLRKLFFTLHSSKKKTKKQQGKKSILFWKKHWWGEGHSLTHNNRCSLQRN